MPQHVISTRRVARESIVPSDVDGDGDLDAVSTAFLGNTVAWHENVGGTAVAWTTRHHPARSAGAARVAAGDLDRDGDVDVAAVQEQLQRRRARVVRQHGRQRQRLDDSDREHGVRPRACTSR